MAPLLANVERFLFEVGGLDQRLRVYHAEAREGLSELFSVELVLACDDSDIEFEQVVGMPATLELMGDDEPRYFNGVVVDFELDSVGQRYTFYRALVVPKIWFLAQRHNSRIFQEMSTQDIVSKVLTDAGIPADEFRFALAGATQTREYCVQYRESELGFISRLLEEEGICYFFEHTYDKHVLVMASGSAAHQDVAGEATLRFHDQSTGNVPDAEHIFAFRYREQVRTGAVTLRDYNFRKPSMLPEGEKPGSKDSKLEFYDYPGLFMDPSAGKALAQVRWEEFRAPVKLATGKSTSPRLTIGYRFELDGHPRASLNKQYLLTRAHHVAAQPQVLEEQAGSAGTEYTCDFECIPSDVPYRPPQLTPKPVVEGAQTAIVVGPSGEEIYPDEHGRVKVQFHWDREGKMDEKSSCWIRVNQPWAGNQWGFMFLPRIGQEVIVDFLEGNPDRPIITGRVYHGTNKPPYSLPDEKTKSTIKSDSSPGGGGFNELRFEDKKGEEQIFIHAERNQDIRVKNDLMEWVGNDRHLIVKNNQNELVEADKSTEVKGDEKEAVQGDHDRYVKGDDVHAIDGAQHITVKGEQREEIGADRNLKVKNNDNNKVAAKYSLDAGGDVHVKAGSNAAIAAGMDVYVKGGANVVVEGAAQLTLKVGGSFISIGPSGVDISGPLVKINSGGAAGSGSPPTPTAPAKPASHETPQAPVEADDAKPGRKTELRQADPTPVEAIEFSSAALVLKQAAEDGTPFCEKCAEASG